MQFWDSPLLFWELGECSFYAGETSAWISLIYSFFCWQALECARTSVFTFLEWTAQPGLFLNRGAVCLTLLEPLPKCLNGLTWRISVTVNVWKACHSQVWSGVSLCQLFEFSWRQTTLNNFKRTCAFVCLFVRSVYSSPVLLCVSDYWTIGVFKCSAQNSFVRHVNYKPSPNLWPAFSFYSCWLLMNTSLKFSAWPVNTSHCA